MTYGREFVMKTRTGRFLVALIIATNVVLLFPKVWAQGGGAPMLIGVQGRLSDANDNPLDGPQSVTFRLYTAEVGGTLIWTEQQNLTVNEGVFDAQLGATTTLKSEYFRYPELWLSTSVGNSPEASRRQLLSTPFAIRAGNGVPAGTVMPFAGSENKIPSGWLLCDGRELDIATYPELHETLEATWGSATAGKFKIPDLRGRTAVGAGDGDGQASALTNRILGESLGEENHTLSEAEMPSHTHDYQDFYWSDSGNVAAFATPNGDDVGSRPDATRTSIATGGSQPHNNMQPSVFLNYIIKL
jgi:microcystin-dependent protein